MAKYVLQDGYDEAGEAGYELCQARTQVDQGMFLNTKLRGAGEGD